VSGPELDLDESRSPGLPDFLQDPIGVLRRRWPWMLPVLLLGLAGTTLLVLRITHTYLATATVLVRSQQIPESFVRPTVDEDPLQRIDEMVGQVLTRDRIDQLIDEHDLYPDRQASEPRSELIGRVQSNIEIAPAPGYTNVARGDSARIFTVSFEYEQPETAARVANEIAGLLPAESVRNRTRKARLATEFLRRELESADRELREQDARIREFKERYRGELPGELQANLGKLERLQAQRQSLALQIAESANRVAALAAESPRGGDATDGPSRLEQLKARLAAERAVKTDRHPEVVALRQAIANLEAEIEQNPGATGSASSQLVAAEHVTLRELRSQLRETEAELAALDARVGRTPARQEELAALEEKASVLRETYLDFLRKVQEAELAQNLEATQSGERVSVLNWATPPTRSERSRVKYLVAGLLATMLGTVAVGVLLEIFDPVLLSVDQMESAGDLPVLGSVPRIA
jgi:uncharacterized protein involved in exopolysaccharide biosynthesis